MSKWSNESIKHNLSEFISEDIKKGYHLDRLILTTYSLENTVLNDIICDLDAVHLIGEGKIDVFYDANSRKPYGILNRICSERYFHMVRLPKLTKDGEKVYAFHPKIILMRYVKPDVESVRYVLIVSSRNISSSNNLDGMVMVYGNVPDSNGPVNEINGKKLSEFMDKIFPEKEEFKKIIEELQHVQFGPEDSDIRMIKFYEGKEIYEEIKDKENLVIVSPFLSDDFIRNLPVKKIAMLISTKKGFASLYDDTVRSLIDSEKVSSCQNICMEGKRRCQMDYRVF